MNKQRLLLADDSITIRKVVELVLADEGFELKLTSDGAQALDALSSFRPDIILADVDMPGLSGYQLAETVKKGPATRSIPVILMVGAFEPVDEELIKKAGADDYIIKPFESHDLISKLRQALAARDAMEAPGFAEGLVLDKAGADMFLRDEAVDTGGRDCLVQEQYVEEVVVPSVEEKAVFAGPVEKEKTLRRTENPEVVARPASLMISPEELKEEIGARIAKGIQEAAGVIDISKGAQAIARELMPEFRAALLEGLSGQARAVAPEVKAGLSEAVIPEVRTAIAESLMPGIKAALIESILPEIKMAIMGPLLSEVRAAFVDLVLPDVKRAAAEAVGSGIQTAQAGPEAKTAAVEAAREAVTDSIRDAQIGPELKTGIMESLLPEIRSAIMETVIPEVRNAVASAVEPEVKKAVRDELPGIVKTVMASTALQVAQSAASDLQAKIEGIVRESVADVALPIIKKEIEDIKSSI